jgi:hypothetical protein
MMEALCDMHTSAHGRRPAGNNNILKGYTMKNRMKRSMLVGATAATLGLAGLTGIGMASAATAATTGQTSLIEKLATKFNLNKDEVTAVFTADHQAREAQMAADQAKRLAQAVTDGKLTQAQADYITNAQKEIKALRGDTAPDQETDATRTSIRTKMDALRTWATSNNVDQQYIGMGGHGGHGGMGGPSGAAPADGSGTSSSSN